MGYDTIHESTSADKISVQLFTGEPLIKDPPRKGQPLIKDTCNVPKVAIIIHLRREQSLYNGHHG